MDAVTARNQNKSSSPAAAAAPASAPVSPSTAGPEQAWLKPLEALLEAALRTQGPEKANALLTDLIGRLRAAGMPTPNTVSTPYINTIRLEDEPAYPGNREIERRIKSLARWNAMAMVVNANHGDSGVGGHISSYASMATLYEVGYNHFFRGGNSG